MIRTLRLQNFKGIRNVEVGLERLTVFVGPNGSGKTSILQGLELLVRSRFDNRFVLLNEIIFNKGYCDKYSPEAEMVLTCEMNIGDYMLKIKPDYQSFVSRNPLDAPDEEEVFSAMGRTANAPDQEWDHSNKRPEILHTLGRAELFRFDPSRMAEPSSGAGDHLRPDGGGLASFLTYLALNQPDHFAVVQRELNALVPTIQRLRFDRSQATQNKVQYNASGQKSTRTFISTLDEIILDLSNGISISARASSEGTMLMLGLLAVLHNQTSRRPQLILIDDLDRGLHPLAQRNVIELLRKVLEQQPDLQIVATTHSPYLVDTLRPEEVRLTTLREDGTVACGRLDDHPDYPRWKDEFVPGEMWSLFGEKWVADLAPEAAK